MRIVIFKLNKNNIMSFNKLLPLSMKLNGERSADN